jgi:hypothetical protein
MARRIGCPTSRLCGCASRFRAWPKLGRSLLFSTGYPPLPFEMQNLENKRFILPLCARSLSLQELHAKSREHGSYGLRAPSPASRPGTSRHEQLCLRAAFRSAGALSAWHLSHGLRRGLHSSAALRLQPLQRGVDSAKGTLHTWLGQFVKDQKLSSG